MILDRVYINKNLYVFNQVRSKPIYLLLGLDAISLHINGFYYLVNILTDQTDIYIRKKF